MEALWWVASEIGDGRSGARARLTVVLCFHLANKSIPRIDLPLRSLHARHLVEQLAEVLGCRVWETCRQGF